MRASSFTSVRQLGRSESYMKVSSEEVQVHHYNNDYFGLVEFYR